MFKRLVIKLNYFCAQIQVASRDRLLPGCLSNLIFNYINDYNLLVHRHFSAVFGSV